MRTVAIAVVLIGLSGFGASSQHSSAPGSQPASETPRSDSQVNTRDPHVVNARVIEVLRKFGCQTDLKPAQHDGIQAVLDLLAATHPGKDGRKSLRLFAATEASYASWLEWMIENGTRSCAKLAAASPGPLRLPPADSSASARDAPTAEPKKPDAAGRREVKKAATEPPRATATRMAPPRPRAEADKVRRADKPVSSSSTSGLPRCGNWTSGPGAPSCVNKKGQVCWNAYGRIVCN